MPRVLGRLRPNLLTYIGATHLFAFGFVGVLLTTSNDIVGCENGSGVYFCDAFSPLTGQKLETRAS